MKIAENLDTENDNIPFTFRIKQIVFSLHKHDAKKEKRRKIREFDL